MSYHDPVLLKESVDGLDIAPDGVYVDVTFGGGGHSREILSRLGEEGQLYAFDQDEDALANAPDDPRFTLINHNFGMMKNHLRFYGVKRVDGILADLGVSSYQFDTPERGFTIRESGPLDMRMNRMGELTAADVVNAYETESLARVLFEYGEIPNSRHIANVIAGARPLNSTADLIALLTTYAPRGKEHKFLAQVFQALRIEVNDELSMLKRMLVQSAEILRTGGRLSVISYHSLEDRLVKNFIKQGVFEGEAEKDLYGIADLPLKAVNRKVIVPSDEEIEKNNRARSAKLRIAEKTER